MGEMETLNGLYLCAIPLSWIFIWIGRESIKTNGQFLVFVLLSVIPFGNFLVAACCLVVVGAGVWEWTAKFLSRPVWWQKRH